MTVRHNFVYGDIKWAVTSQFGYGPRLERIAAGALELDFPYYYNGGIPKDFDAPDRFIDRAMPFTNLVVCEVGFDGQGLDLVRMHDVGAELMSTCGKVELPPVHLHGLSLSSLAAGIRSGGSFTPPLEGIA